MFWTMGWLCLMFPWLPWNHYVHHFIYPILLVSFPLCLWWDECYLQNVNVDDLKLVRYWAYAKNYVVLNYVFIIVIEPCDTSMPNATVIHQRWRWWLGWMDHKISLPWWPSICPIFLPTYVPYAPSYKVTWNGNYIWGKSIIFNYG
jgi:hypothetical protein